MEIETSREDIRDTEISAISEYISALANKIAKNSDNAAYFQSREVAHGELAAEFENDIGELLRAGIAMANITSTANYENRKPADA